MKQRAILGNKLLNPTDYLTSVELKSDLTLTIAGVKHEPLMRQDLREPDIKPVLSFKETNKKLVLGSRTNEDSVCRLHGTDAEKWIGKKITLYATTTRMGRDTVPCIRIRNKNPAETEAPLGKKAAEKLESAVAEAGKDLGELVAYLANEHGITGKPETWPRGMAPVIRKWIDEGGK